MKYESVRRAVFLERLNRFVARIVPEGSGEPVLCHVKNTGRCRELLIPGAAVYVQDHRQRMGNRKLAFSLIAVEKRRERDCLLVNLDAQAPNKVAEEALMEGINLFLPEFMPGQLPAGSRKGTGGSFRISAAPGENPGRAGGFSGEESRQSRRKSAFAGTAGSGQTGILFREKTFERSRFDFYWQGETEKGIFLEIKGVTLEEGGTARFPDAPTERGVRHIEELMLARSRGFGAGIIFVIQMEQMECFRPNDETHPAFGAALRAAASAGVALGAIGCRVTPDSLTPAGPVPVLL